MAKKPSIANAKPSKKAPAPKSDKPVLVGPQEYNPEVEYVIEKGRKADEWHAPILLRVPDAFRNAITEYLTDEETGEQEQSRTSFIIETIAKKIGYDGPLSAPKPEPKPKAEKKAKAPKQEKKAKAEKAPKAPKAKKEKKAKTIPVVQEDATPSVEEALSAQ